MTHTHTSYHSKQKMCHSRTKILELNGVPTANLDWDEVVELSDDLMADAEAALKYDRSCQPHRNPKLEKFYYKHFEGTKKSAYHDKNDTLTSNSTIKKEATKALEVGPAQLHIKVENQALIDLKAEVKVLITGKGKLAGVLEKAHDLSALFEAQKDGTPDDYEKEVHEQLKAKIKISEDFKDIARILP